MSAFIFKRPHQEPEVIDHYGDWSLKELQDLVGGAIETTTPFSDLTIISNRDAVFSDAPFNCNICGLQLFGPIVIVGVKGDEFVNFKFDKAYDAVKLLFGVDLRDDMRPPYKEAAT